MIYFKGVELVIEFESIFSVFYLLVTRFWMVIIFFLDEVWVFVVLLFVLNGDSFLGCLWVLKGSECEYESVWKW